MPKKTKIRSLFRQLVSAHAENEEVDLRDDFDVSEHTYLELESLLDSAVEEASLPPRELLDELPPGVIVSSTAD